MKELLAHLAGDYVLQTHYEATGKVDNWVPAFSHAAKYTACFLPLTRNPLRLALIGGTHLLIDHYRVAKHVSWAKNQLAPARYRYEYNPDNNGYPEGTPPWLSTWLMIITDNAMHMAINHLALKDYSE